MLGDLAIGDAEDVDAGDRAGLAATLPDAARPQFLAGALGALDQVEHHVL
jgi:hypothetical protein